MNELNLKIEKKLDSVEEYEFEPIKGFPMLSWQGKRPFTSTQYYPAQLKETHGEEVDGWFNKMFWGDNLQVMSHLLKKYRGQVDFIYLDPPFDSKADYKLKIELKNKKIFNDNTSFEEKQYTDIWNNDEYLQFMYERLILLKELMSDNAVVILHCDWHKVHLLRCIMDEIFGGDNFINEIIWEYFTGGVSNKFFSRKHDNILIYRKTKDYTFNLLKEKSYIPTLAGRTFAIEKLGAKQDEKGEWYKYSNMRDVWDITALFRNSRERVDYPTQKPIHIIYRLLLAFTNKDDLVFDPFMGSGTTLHAAMNLSRKFIGADINLGAIQKTTKRLLDEILDNTVLFKSIDFDFIYEEKVIYNKYNNVSIYNVNHYELFRNPVEAKELIVKALEIQPLPQNTLYDGEKDGRMVKIMPINRIATKADLNELITGFNYKRFEKLSDANPNKPVELITIVCMGHEPSLGAKLEKAIHPYKIDVEVVDILRDKAELEFKRDAEADVVIEGDKLVIREFFPMNLLQKLSLMKDNVNDWKELVESVMIDFNFDGSVFEPKTVDIPEKNELVKGIYTIPAKAGTIKVKITDLLSESFETTINNG